MRIAFFGTPALAAPSLKAVAEAHEVTAVVCQPDKPQGRSKKPLPPPTKTWAEEHEKLNTYQYGELHEELAMQRQGVNREGG